MYGVLRPVLRAQRPPARFIHRRRYPLPLPNRTRRLFHSTPTLAHDPNIPTGADGRPIGAGSNGASDKKKGEEAGVGAVEQPDGAPVPEDPELLAQKLQRSRDMARRYSSALRRNQRRNKAQDLPPVVIPEWFMQERVILRDEPRRYNSLQYPEMTLSLRRRDAEDDAKLSIPIPDPSIGVKLLTRWIHTAWEGGLSTPKTREIAKQLAAAWGLGQDERVIEALVRGHDPDAAAGALRDQLRERLPTLKKELEETRRLVDEAGNERLVEMKKETEEKERSLAASMYFYERFMGAHDPNQKTHVSPLVLAEIRATIAASLSTLEPAENDTYPSTRTNLTLHSPFTHLDETINRTVKAIASELGADVVELSAQDLAEIAGDYLGEGPEPTPHSIRSLGYETYRLSSDLDGIVDEMENDGEDEESDAPNAFSIGSAPAAIIPGKPMVFPLASMLKNLSQHLKGMQETHVEPEPADEGQGRVQTQAEMQLEDLKITNLLEHLIGATDSKRFKSTGAQEKTQSTTEELASSEASPAFFDSTMPAIKNAVDLDTSLPSNAASRNVFSLKINPPRKSAAVSSPSKIVFVQDIKELSATQYGSRIIDRLEEIVRRQRSAGESIMIVGTTCSRDLTPELSVDGVQGLQADGDSGFFRNIVVPAEPTDALRGSSDLSTGGSSRGYSKALSLLTAAEKKKFRGINLRHIQNMLRSLDPVASEQITARLDRDNLQDMRSSQALLTDVCSHKVLTHDEVHRIALTTLGLRLVDPACKQLNWSHVALATGLLKASDEAKFEYVKRKAEIQRSVRSSPSSPPRSKKENSRDRPQNPGVVSEEDRRRQLQAIGANADKYERRLMSGIVNPGQIKTGFDQVHVPAETIEALRTLTSLSFLRPDAFNYGVLATEKISGALLYGPPGTGKTLLAKAVAKESGCAVLEVSGSQIHDKYVGEGEKNVAAIFSLARKLSPCVVFLDEADAVLSSRDTGRERPSARDILNQFLKEWDGLNDHSVFVMVATNRPFDLDDAVIRRLPRRLLVDLPTENDRKAIFNIHLRGEQLDSSVDIEKLAKQTPFYSGSDLKNIAVAAALACVKEENIAAIAAAAALSSVPPPLPDSSTSDSPSESSNFIPPPPPLPSLATTPLSLLQNTTYKFPAKRTLHLHHFEKALQEISASISEDMSSLSAIKKFDEKYGDKKGRKKKTVFGIGVGNGEVSESVARVRG